MSLTSILRNIYSFVEVLQQSRGNAVASWDNQALSNAYQWAQYCEQIFHQAEGKPYESSLNHQIEKMCQLPLSLGDVQLNLQLCAKASHVLTQGLLQNPHLDDSLYMEVISKYGNREGGMDQLLSDCYDINKDKAGLQMALCARDTLCSPVKMDNDIPLEAVETQAELLVAHLDAIIRNTKHKDKGKAYVEGKLAEVYPSEEGPAVLLQCLVSDHGSCTQASPLNHDQSIQHRILECTHASPLNHDQSIQHRILEWILHNCQSPAQASRLFTCSSSQLVAASGRYHSIYDHYMAYIVTLARTMQPVYGRIYPRGYKWRSGENAASKSYTDLVSILQQLKCHAPHLDNAVTKTIQEKAKHKEFSIWKDIMQDLDHEPT